jgi:hypothetical protein
MKFAPTLFVTAIISLISTNAFAQQMYRLSVVPPLAGFKDNYAISINEFGDVSGYGINYTPAMSQLGFVYRGGVTTSIGKLSAKSGFSIANYVSPSGQVIGVSDTGDGRPQGMTKIGAKVYNIFPNNGGNTHALRSDAQGRIYGYSFRRGGVSCQGAMWTPNPNKAGTYTETKLGAPGNPWSFNSVGQGTGYATGARQSAAFWNNTGVRAIQILPTKPEFTSSLGFSISDIGDIVGVGYPAFSAQPLLWTASTGYTLTELPVLPGDNFGVASVINNAGTIIGTSAYTDPVTQEVVGGQYVVWTNGIPTPLTALLDPISSSGWKIMGILGINNKGQVAANASDGTVVRAVILTPIL